MALPALAFLPRFPTAAEPRLSPSRGGGGGGAATSRPQAPAVPAPSGATWKPPTRPQACTALGTRAPAKEGTERAGGISPPPMSPHGDPTVSPPAAAQLLDTPREYLL